MAGKRNANKKILEAVPAEEGNMTMAEGVTEQDSPAADVLTKPEGMWSVSDKEEAAEPGTAETDVPEERIFRITCRNKISESVGGVEFVDGTGYTRDGFSASWFANKSGYTVSRADSGE